MRSPELTDPGGGDPRLAHVAATFFLEEEIGPTLFSHEQIQGTPVYEGDCRQDGQLGLE